MHSRNAFLTLTYDDKHLPANYSIEVRELQLFMKRLRKSLPQSIRFFGVGEYGDETLRPHYHALIFNYFPDDQKFYKKSKSGYNIFTSENLSKVWTFGNSWVGSVTYQSAAYVARYCMKKINGDLAAEHYTRQHPLTGVYHTVAPEFCVQSRRPGIGSTWFDQNKGDCFPSDFLIMDGKRVAVPDFYVKKLAEAEVTPLKRTRRLKALKHKSDNTRERLMVRREVLQSKITRLKREV